MIFHSEIIIAVPPLLLSYLQCVAIDQQQGCCREFLYFFIRSVFFVKTSKPKIMSHVIKLHFQWKLTFQRIEFTSKNYFFLIGIIIQWFFSGSVSGYKNSIVVMVINSKNKHTVKVLKHVFSHPFIQQQQGFCIRMGAAFQCKLFSELKVIVNLTIKNNGVPIVIGHWLFSPFYIEDG